MSTQDRCSHSFRGPLIIAMSLVLLAPVIHAQTTQSRLREELDQMLVHLAQEGLLGPDVTRIETPSRRVANFGALVDRDHQDGLLVLGILPGGSAEELGLRTGDRMLAANGIALNGPGGSDRFRTLLSMLDDGDEIDLRIRRTDRTVDLSGPVTVHALPAARLALIPAADGDTETRDDDRSRCARVSVFPAAARSKHLFPAIAVTIDGRSGSVDQDTFRVSPGRRLITVAENIDSDRFSAIANRRRIAAPTARHKSLEIDAQAGVTYFVAARLYPEHANRIGEGRYWEPVVWKTRSERCR